MFTATEEIDLWWMEQGDADWIISQAARITQTHNTVLIRSLNRLKVEVILYFFKGLTTEHMTDKQVE